MKTFYPALIKFNKNDQRYLVKFPDLPEAISEAVTLEEAYLNATKVLTLTLKGRMDEEMKIPAPSKIKGAVMIASLVQI